MSVWAFVLLRSQDAYHVEEASFLRYSGIFRCISFCLSLVHSMTTHCLFLNVLHFLSKSILSDASFIFGHSLSQQMESQRHLQQSNRSPQNDRPGTLRNSQNGPNSRFPPFGALYYFNYRQHESDIPYPTFSSQQGGPSVNPVLSLSFRDIQAEPSNFRGNYQGWMNGQDAFQPYAVHVIASRTPPLWQPLPPIYPAGMQPVPYQTSILPISDQYNLESQSLTNHIDPLLNEPNQTMEAIR
jgi:hypothetical protein